MAVIRIDNYIIDTPIDKILYDIRLSLTNGKLKEIRVGGKEIVVTCPNDDHDGGCEKNPDCHICIDENDAGYGIFHCFACGASGNFVKFVALCFSSSIGYAKAWLIKNYGVESFDKISIGDFIKIDNKPKELKKIDNAILDQYQKWCPYLAKRKLSRSICEMFNVRYDTYNRQIIFPVYDAYDNLVMFARRSIDTKFFHMDSGVEKEVYCLNYINKNNIGTCLITEGPFDCLTAYEYGFPAIATLGAISDYQIDQINKSCINVLYLCMDNDAAGKKFIDFLKLKLNKRIILKDVNFPAGKKDINDLSKDELIYCLKNAK